MAQFCSGCGAALGELSKFCGGCGMAVPVPIISKSVSVVPRFCNTCGSPLTAEATYCGQCGARITREAPEERRTKVPTSVRVVLLLMKLLGAIILWYIALGLTLDYHWLGIDPRTNVIGAILTYLIMAAIGYFVLRSSWLGAPIPLRRKLTILLLGAITVTVGWFYLDSGPITSFGSVEWSMQGCAFDQRQGVWPHRFTMTPTSDGRCPYSEEVGYLTEDGHKVLDKDGEAIVLYRRMVRDR